MTHTCTDPKARRCQSRNQRSVRVRFENGRAYLDVTIRMDGDDRGGAVFDLVRIHHCPFCGQKL